MSTRCSSDPCLHENEFLVPYTQKLIAPKGSSIVQKYSFHNYCMEGKCIAETASFPTSRHCNTRAVSIDDVSHVFNSFHISKKTTPNILGNCSYLTKPQAFTSTHHNILSGLLKNTCNRSCSQALTVLNSHFLP